MEFDFGDDVKLEPMEPDLQEDPKLEADISIEDTVLMKTEPNENGGQVQGESRDFECKVDAQHLGLTPDSSDEDEMSVTNCFHHPDSFCYVCGVYMYKSRNRKSEARMSISIASRPSFHRIYSDYFGLEIRDQHEPWVPHFVCKTCCSTLTKWECGTGKGLPFGTPRIWLKPSDHFQDCYFCMTVITNGRKPNMYPDLPSSRPPDYCKVAPGRNRSKNLVELPMESGSPSNPNGIKLEAIEQGRVSLENPTANCKQRPERFCYICGSYLLVKKRYPMNDPNLWRLYVVYFEVDVDPPAHPWEPQFSCVNCSNRLKAWRDQKGDGLPFGAPRMWSKPSDNHSMDCYFCVVPVLAGRQLNFDVDIPSSRAPDYSIKAPGKIENLQIYDDLVSKDTKQESDDSDGEEKGPFANCKRQPNEFCFVCGRFVDSRNAMSPRLWAAYKEYFQLDVDLPVHPWEPKFTCRRCCTYLYAWYKGLNRSFQFAVPRRWKEPTNHATDCYFCLVDISGRKSSWSYPDLPSSRAPVPVDADHPRRERRVVVNR